MNALYKALFDLQRDVPKVKKDKDNPFFHAKYADLDAVVSKVVPMLQKHGLAVIQALDNLNGEPALTTTVWHISGESVTHTMPLIVPKQDPQAQGSAITYARRYSFMVATGMVANDDDDGVGASYAMTGLNKKKQDLYKAFIKSGNREFADQKLYINSVIGKETIDDIFDADNVLKALKSDEGKEER